MFKNILNTLFTKIFIAVLSFLIIIINSKELGAGGVGEVSLIVLSISIYLLIHEFFSGAFVYFVPRVNNFQLLFIAYIGVFIVLVPFSVLYFYIPLAPIKYFYYVLSLSVIFSFSNINQLILLGKENISGRNLINFLQVFTVFLLLIYFFYVVKKITVYSYIYSLFSAYSLGLLISFIKIKKYINNFSLSGIRVLFVQLVRLGFYNSVSNLIQKMNYRISYYFIERFLGIAALGRFSVGVQLSESTWLIGQSVASVQYARISNTEDNEKAISLTLSLVKILFVLSFLMIAFLSVLPGSFYRWIFGSEFSDINTIVWSLALGIVALSCNMIFSHYFSGTGQYKINTLASLTGLVFIVGLGLILIPEYRLIGAGISMSVSYIATTLFSAFVFVKKNNVLWSDLLIRKRDFIELKQFIEQKLAKNL